jgi:hypothetical protein
MRFARSGDSGPPAAAGTTGGTRLSCGESSTALEILGSNSNVTRSEVMSVAMEVPTLED